MALQIENLIRIFKHDDNNLTDPNPNLSIEEVTSHFSAQYPELTTATITGPTVEGKKAIYEYKSTVGTKG